MKKFITLFLMMALVSLSAVNAQQTREYASDEMPTLLADLLTAVDGDEFILTTSGDIGVYRVDSMALQVYADITIKAQSGLAVKPTVKLVQNANVDMTDYLIRLRAPEVALTLYNIEIQGDTNLTKYGIRTAKVADFEDDHGFYDFKDPLYDLRIVQNYKLNIIGCNINGIKSGGDGRGIILYPGTFGTVIIKNTTFSAMERDAIDLYSDTDGTSMHGPWKFVDSLVAENCTFYDLGRETIVYRNSGEKFDETNTAMTSKIILNNCTVDDCGKNATTDSYYPLRVDAPILNITNSLFTNMASKSYIIGANKNIASRIDSVALFNTFEAHADSADVFEFSNIKDAIEVIYDRNGDGDTLPVIGTGVSLNMTDPKYADAATGDFTLAADSEVLGLGSDGRALGDQRWAPGYIAADNADLTGITINGVEVADFSADVTTYNLELPMGTTEITEVMATTLNPDATSMEELPAELPGSVVVTVTSYDGFSEKEYDVLVTVSTVGVDTEKLNANNIYPNPSNGTFTIDNNEGSNLVVYNVTGQVVYSQSIISNNEVVSSDLREGVYFVVVGNQQDTKVSKIIIE